MKRSSIKNIKPELISYERVCRRICKSSPVKKKITSTPLIEKIDKKCCKSLNDLFSEMNFKEKPAREVPLEKPTKKKNTLLITVLKKNFKKRVEEEKALENQRKAEERKRSKGQYDGGWIKGENNDQKSRRVTRYFIPT